MTNVTALAPRKSMTQPERKLLQVLAQELPTMPAGPTVLAVLLQLVASWMGSPSPLGFEDFAKGWVQQGNVKGAAAEQLLRDVLGMNTTPKGDA
ncbi:hypothetical protein [Pseudomonas sp.]|uniref:hypothetical protein n=1 Tax=Pseudomonas sp. TaxID=306 RepID=UPI0029120926|nr:hypothetical protein [Pseudomonas sp.]MDU4255948.1 hypothetical protein [Pseudomonas sp.]